MYLGLEGQSLEIFNIVDIREEYNREIAMRISSDIETHNRFYSDLNGYQVTNSIRSNTAASPFPVCLVAFLLSSFSQLTVTP